MKVADVEVDPWPRRLLDGYTPRAPWCDDPATRKQVEALERRGYLPPDELTKGQAAFALNRPTPKQLKILSAKKLYEVGDGDMSFNEASRMIDSIARDEGWA